MATKDERLGEELAELARQFLLWLREHELPGVPGLKGSLPDHFRLYAGTYHKLNRTRPGQFDNRLLPNLWTDQPDELRRMAGLRLGISHVLLVDNPHEDVTLPDGRVSGSNRIVLADPRPRAERPQRPLERPGALMTVKPQLNSRTADDTTLSRVHNYDFAAILNRVDLGYDDAAAGAQAHFQYPYLLDYTPPRQAYQVNVQDVPVPLQLDPGPGPLHDRILAQRINEFREHLYHNATYRNRRRAAERGGNYYPKWRAKTPLDQRQRQFRPTLLSDDYLHENFTEFVMKKGDDLLLIDLPDARYLYRLLWQWQPGNPTATPTFTVQPLLTIGGVGKRPPAREGQRGPGSGSDAGEDAGDSGVQFPVTAVFFRAVDGADQLPTQIGFGKLDYRGKLPQRFIVDYKAFLRWYYNDPKLQYRNDKEWLDTFIDVFFGDQGYPIELNLTPANPPDREALFLGALRQAASETPAGPIKDRLTELVAWCDDPATKDRRYVLTQGMMIGTQDNPRQLIGITPRLDVFEWHPDTGHVTVIKFDAWLSEITTEILAADVYRNTAGMLPFITLVTWGGVIVMTGGVVGVPATMTALARGTVMKLATQATGSTIAKNAAVAARRILVAELVEAAMSLIPKSDSLLYEFIRGLFEGLGSGAAERYLSETDERLKRMVDRIPRIAANYVTKNGYQAYIVYDKVRSALTKLAGVIRALRTVLTDNRAKLVVQQLDRVGRYVGEAFLIIVFVVVYLDWVYRSRPDIAVDKWEKEQRKTLHWMVAHTGDEIVNYAKELRNDLLPVGNDVTSPAATAAVRKHDQHLTGVVTGKLRDGVAALPAITDFLQMLLGRMGIHNWQELRNLGFTDVMTRGAAALATGNFVADQVRRLGAAFGELVSTIMLERKIVPDSVKANTGLLFDRRPTARATKTALEGGTWRALWRFAIYPFEHLGDIPGSLKRGLEEQGGRSDHGLTQVRRRDTAYRDFIESLIGDEEELARRIAKLAIDEELENKLRTMVSSAAANIMPPSLADLTRKENADWPSEAIMFLLYCWLRLGLRQLGEMFNLIEDDQPYGTVFRLADLLEILGLDVAVDDQTLAALKATFVRKP